MAQGNVNEVEVEVSLRTKVFLTQQMKDKMKQLFPYAYDLFPDDEYVAYMYLQYTLTEMLAEKIFTLPDEIQVTEVK